MKKFYLVITLFICFFVFSLETNAESQDNITTSSGNLTQISLHNKRLVYNRYNNYPPQYNNDVYNITMPFMGYNFTLSSMSSSNSLKFGAYYDYFCNKHSNHDACNSGTTSITSQYFNTIYNMGENLLSHLESMLPENAHKDDYYIISYFIYNSDNIELLLTYLPSPIYYNDLDGLKDFVVCDIKNTLDVFSDVSVCQTFSLKNSTMVYRFKVTNNIEYVGYRSVSYKDLMNNFNFGKSIIQKESPFEYYHISSYFYNFFYMSNFNIFPYTFSISFVPGYSVVSLFDMFDFDYKMLDSDFDDYYGLEYFNKYPFSAGTIGIKPLYSVLNYKTSQKPPFNGEYSQLITTHKHTHSQLNSYVSESTLYFNGSLGIVYTENNQPTLKKKPLVYTCPRDQLDKFCIIKLDFTGLDKPGVSLIVDSEILIDNYKLGKEDASMSPVIWYKTKDFDLYTSGVNNWDDLICYNCEPDENGKLPTIHVPIEDIKNYVDLTDIEYINNIIKLGGMFSRNKNSASSILKASTELLSLVTSFYNSFSTPVKAIILMIFLVGVIVIFLRFIM